jgi:hypothetical protein
MNKISADFVTSFVEGGFQNLIWPLGMQAINQVGVSMTTGVIIPCNMRMTVWKIIVVVRAF